MADTARVVRAGAELTVPATEVVVGDLATPPTGYSAETEYWSWTSGNAWRPAFKLVPTATVPSHASSTWQTCAHAYFDLSHTVPFRR